MKQKRFKDYLNRRLLSIFLLGFSSGLPLALALGSLQAWYTIENIDIVAIGCLTLVSYPYSFKFIWAPLLDRFVPPFLGRRRGWILITQLVLTCLMIVMASLSPSINPILLAFMALLLAFCSASQDIAFDAYKTEILPSDERGVGAALSVEGYRIAMLTSSAFALYLADNIGWQKTYLIMSGIMFCSIVGTFLAPATKKIKTVIKENVFSTFKVSLLEFFTREKVILILCLVIFYKFGEAFSLSLITPFLLKGIGFSQTQVAFINKTVGLLASLIGIFFGGLLMTKIGLYRALFAFGILQAVTNLLYMYLALIGKNYIFASIAVFIENLCGGMGTAALVSLIMSLCNKKFAATQFALLSSLMVIGRFTAGPVSGVLVKNFGWYQFYFCTFIFALPGLVFLYLLRFQIGKESSEIDETSVGDEKEEVLV